METDKQDIRNKVKSDNYFHDLMIEFTPLINSLISQYTLKKGDYLVSKEDLYQEAYLALFEASSNYEESYGTNFSTFAYVVIKRKLNKVFYKQAKRYEQECISYDRLTEDHMKEMGSCINEKGILYDENAEDEIKKLLHNSMLSAQDKQIIKMRLEKKSYKEIAEKLGINTKRVDNRIARIKRILKKNINNQ